MCGDVAAKGKTLVPFRENGWRLGWASPTTTCMSLFLFLLLIFQLQSDPTSHIDILLGPLVTEKEIIGKQARQAHEQLEHTHAHLPIGQDFVSMVCQLNDIRLWSNNRTDHSDIKWL